MPPPLRLPPTIPHSYRIVFVPGTSDDAQDAHIEWTATLGNTLSGAVVDWSMRDAYCGVFDDATIAVIEDRPEVSFHGMRGEGRAGGGKAEEEGTRQEKEQR